MTVAKIFKRCDCGDWDGCPHQWVVRYRTHRRPVQPSA